MHEQSNYRPFCQRNKSEWKVITKTVEKMWLSTLALHHCCSPVSQGVTGFPWWYLVAKIKKKNLEVFFFSFLSSEVNLSTGRLFNKLSLVPFYIVTRILQESLQADYTKQSQPVHFPNTFLTINIYLKYTEQMSCFGFQRPKVPVPGKRTEIELLRYPGVNTGKGRNSAWSQSIQTCLPLS